MRISSGSSFWPELSAPSESSSQGTHRAQKSLPAVIVPTHLNSPAEVMGWNHVGVMRPTAKHSLLAPPCAPNRKQKDSAQRGARGPKRNSREAENVIASGHFRLAGLARTTTISTASLKGWLAQFCERMPRQPQKTVGRHSQKQQCRDSVCASRAPRPRAKSVERAEPDLVRGQDRGCSWDRRARLFPPGY
jgi:hypothetical protein